MNLPQIRPVFFGAILGIAGLSNGWRAAARLWHLPAAIGETLALTATVLWLVMLLLYAAGWLLRRQQATAELRHPVQGLLTALVPVTTMLIAIALVPYLPGTGKVLLLLGLAGAAGFAAWSVGGLWQGGRVSETTTPILYMPTVGGGLVGAIACGSYGMYQTGWMFFGLGLLSWLVMESVVISRLLTVSLPVEQRATLGVHLAPPAVAAVACLAIDGPDQLTLVLFGYGCFQALVMLRLLPWLRQQPFAAPAWAYTFGVSALPLAALRLVERGQDGVVAALAVLLFAAANLIIGWIAARSVLRMLRPVKG